MCLLEAAGPAVISAASMSGMPVGDFFTISGVEEKHTSLSSGNAIKDAFPFLFRFSYRPIVFRVTAEHGGGIDCQ